MTPAQVALAWLLAHRPWIVPIPGATKWHRLEENLGAPSLQLTADDLREIDDAASHGARYPEHLQKLVAADAGGKGERCGGPGPARGARRRRRKGR